MKEMAAEGLPEMQSSNLVSCVVELKALGVDNILGFDWPASPPESMIRALEVLYSLDVLDKDAKLTSPTDFQVSEIPLDPMISKMILAADSLGCTEEGDHVTYLNIYKGFLQSGKSSQWCHNNFINYQGIKVLEVRQELQRLLGRFGIGMKSCEKDTDILQKAIIAGFFANACRLES